MKTKIILIIAVMCSLCIVSCSYKDNACRHIYTLEVESVCYTKKTIILTYDYEVNFYIDMVYGNSVLRASRKTGGVQEIALSSVITFKLLNTKKINEN